MSARSTNWRPLAGGELAGRFDAVVTEIAEALRPLREQAHSHGPTLGTGEGGIALFFHYLERSRLGGPYAGAAEAFLEKAVSAAEQNALWFDLYGGVSGIAWLHQHILGYRDDDGSLDEVDDALVTLLAKDKWTLPYDLIIGLAGMGVYALERWPGGRSREILARVVHHLLARVEPAEVGATCFTPQSQLLPPQAEQHPSGYYNLGVAHGVPAVTAVLAAASQLGVGGEAPGQAVRDTVEWMLSCQLDGVAGTRFPSVIEPGGKRTRTRLAWCYGDAGVAGVLLCVARLLRDEELARQAQEIARHAVSLPEEATGVADAPLCHGAAGIAHIYNRFFQATGEQVFADAALGWYERALAYQRPGTGIAGFQARRATGWEDSAGFLEGATGIGLALLAATEDVEPAWDRLLLLSLAV